MPSVLYDLNQVNCFYLGAASQNIFGSDRIPMNALVIFLSVLFVYVVTIHNGPPPLIILEVISFNIIVTDIVIPSIDSDPKAFRSCSEYIFQLSQSTMASSPPLPVPELTN